MNDRENRFMYTNDDCPEIEKGDLRKVLPRTLYILRYGVDRDDVDTDSDAGSDGGGE